MTAPVTVFWCWRHPRAIAAAGRCIGSSDIPVDPRKAKRLAARIRRAAERHDLPRVLHVSPLERSRAVGRWLRRWGWELRVDARLREVDFGRWDGLPWSDIAWAEVEAWQEDLLHHAPGGGESLLAVAARVQDFVREHSGDVLLVSHGGWINALRALPPGTTTLAAANWSAAPAHSSLTRWVVPARG